jgi:tripartite-type tricarboxylate transporter receptor subunit TctC
MEDRILGGSMRLKLFALAAAALLPCANLAYAQSNWPTRPVTLVVGFAAGGGCVVLARLVGR